jgi:hypothetical protein
LAASDGEEAFLRGTCRLLYLASGEIVVVVGVGVGVVASCYTMNSSQLTMQ